MLPCLQNPTTHYCTNVSPDYGLISDNPLTWIDKGTTKSIYDPCPYGYRVPKDGSWANWPNPHTQKWTNGDITSGAGIVMQSTWWPASGYRIDRSAAMNAVANTTYYWASSFYSSPTNNQSYYFYFNYNGGVHPSSYYNRSYGLSLRCVQE